MEDMEIVKRRVKKLLALSNSPNENEAAAALRKANDLMAGCTRKRCRKSLCDISLQRP